MINLENEYVRLRALEPEDLDLLYSWENNPEIWQVSNTVAPFSRYQLKQYIENSSNDIFQNKQLRLMIDSVKENKSIGCIDLFDFEPLHSRAGVGILVKKEAQGKQYASNSLKLLIDYAFKVLMLKQLYCNILADNLVSLKLFENHGFVKIGLKQEWQKTNNGWKGEYMLQLINN